MRPLSLVLLLIACAPAPSEPRTFVAVTFNTGTTEGLPHDDEPDDGFGSTQAKWSNDHYGDGLAWTRAVEDTRAYLARLEPDVIAFQEIFHSPNCAEVPQQAREGFVCETWKPGDPTVAQVILGAGYQVACHTGHPDKCAGVRRSFGRFRGCDGDFCLEGLEGFAVSGCGRGARVARGVVEIEGGGSFTLVTLHGTSGIEQEDLDCRVKQVEQIFVDLGDGAPAANGGRNLILGDLNTDPGRLAGADPSADRWLDFAGEAGEAGENKRFRFLSPIGERAPPTTAGLFNIDHVVSDAFSGTCAAEKEPVTQMVYFDHVPIVCTLIDP